MKSYIAFKHEVDRLIAFFKATTYAYEQSELSIRYKNKKGVAYDTEIDDGFKVLTPTYFKIKKSSKFEIKRSLNELVFVRLISALEVFLIDIIRDIFLKTKEPFKRNDLRLELNHAELLSLKSTAEIFSKIINRESRKLSSAGYDEIVKYFRRHFSIDIDSFTPGKKKIEEYHDRRHLLVHRLGKTDIAFRDKYNYTKNSIRIDEDYLFNCVDDFKNYAELVNRQVEYYLENEIPKIVAKSNLIERRVKLEIRSNETVSEFFEDSFEFWVDDEFRMLKDILERREIYDESNFDLTIAGSFREVKSYVKVVRRNAKVKKYLLTEVSEFVKLQEKSNVPIIHILDASVLETVKNELPPQPWEKGIHKIVAAKIGSTNKLVSIAIQQLIATKVFKPQIDGIVLEHKE